MSSDSHTNGYVTIMSIRMIRADGMANVRQYDAPMVFGMISESTNMSRVSMADIIPKYASPNIFTDSEPTPAAPIVWATVFNVSMAAYVGFVFHQQRG